LVVVSIIGMWFERRCSAIGAWRFLLGLILEMMSLIIFGKMYFTEGGAHQFILVKLADNLPQELMSTLTLGGNLLGVNLPLRIICWKAATPRETTTHHPPRAKVFQTTRSRRIRNNPPVE